MKSVIRSFSFITTVVGVLFSASAVFAWVGPTQTAPAGNTAPPINTSATSQVKVGGFWAASVGSDSGYCIGASCISAWPSGGASQWTTNGTSIYYNGGNVGIGNSSPNFELTANVTSSGGLALNAYENGSPRASWGPIVRGFAARGTASAPTKVKQGDDLLSLHASGFWTGKTDPYFIPLDARAGIQLFATEDWVGPSNNGTGILFFTTPNGSNTYREVVRFDQNGNVGIGTATPVSKLQVSGTATFGTDANGTVSAWSTPGEGGTINLRSSNGTNMFLEGTNGIFRLVNSGWTAQLFSVDQAGNTVAAGNVTALGYFHSSDLRLKDNVTTSSGLSVVEKLRGVTFDWKKDGTSSAGVIAQEVEAVLPSAVHTDASGMKTVEYDQLIAPLIESIKEQQVEINDLKQQVTELKAAQVK